MPQKKHSGLLQTYRGKTREEIQRAIRSDEKQVALHEQKLADPEVAVQDWSRFTAQEQRGLIAKWQKDLARNREFVELMRDLLREREQSDR